jgi:hypothetical protein
VTFRSGDAAMSTIPDALQVYGQLKGLVTARRPAVFLDFDGTLSERLGTLDRSTSNVVVACNVSRPGTPLRSSEWSRQVTIAAKRGPNGPAGLPAITNNVSD